MLCICYNYHMQTKTYEIKTKDIYTTFESRESGLTSIEVSEKRKKFGLNTLPEKKPRGLIQIFISQFKSPLIYVLFAAAVIVFLLNEKVDAVIIFLVLVFNAFVGTFQEGRAQNTLSALKKFVETKATVLRSDHEIIIPDVEVVPGDVVILQEGDKVPADLRMVSTNNLKIDEAALTGESEAVYKTAGDISDPNAITADQTNMAFKGTHVVAGLGRGVVAATGASTQIGKISQEIAKDTDDSPLKEDVAFLSKIIIATVVVISVILFLMGIAQGKPAKEMFTVVVALSVSVIPEGLPIVMTLVLATGVWRMAKKNALVKKLQSVEALGQARIIAVDKTGTVTKNEMEVKRVYIPGKMFELSGDGYAPRGKIYFEGKDINYQDYPDLPLFLKINVLVPNARIAFSESSKKWQAGGDPTEAAMVSLGEKFGFSKDEQENLNPRIGEIPFDYKQKYHAVLNKIARKNFALIAGAPEVILDKASKTVKDGQVYALGALEREEFLQTFQKMSAMGLRVLGFAFKTIIKRSPL